VAGTEPLEGSTLDDGEEVEAEDEVPYTLRPTPYSLHPKPETRNPKPETLNSNALNSEHYTHRVSSSPLGPVDPSFRALSGRLKFTARRHKLNKDSLSGGGGESGPLMPS